MISISLRLDLFFLLDLIDDVLAHFSDLGHLALQGRHLRDQLEVGLRLVFTVLQAAQADCVHPWQPLVVGLLAKGLHIGLDTVVVAGVDSVQVSDVEHVHPHVVVLLDMALEAAVAELVEQQSLKIADEAAAVHVLLFGALVVSQRGESVNDLTEEHVEHDDLDDDVERGVVTELDQVSLAHLVVVYRLSDIADASTEAQALVQHSHEALEHCQAVVLADDVRVIRIDIVIVHVLLDVEERQRGVDVHDDDEQDHGQRKRLNIVRDGTHHILQRTESGNDVEQMERIVDVLRCEAQQRYSKVQYVVLELAVLHEEEHGEYFMLDSCEEVAEVQELLLSFLVFVVELWSAGAAQHEDQVRHLEGHLAHLESRVLQQVPVLCLVGLVEVTPALLDDQLLLILGIQVDQYA